MSKAWAGGSTTRWRKLRLRVLNRDGWVCQLCSQPINPSLPRTHPRSAQVHHLDGREYGDDPDRLVAAHRECNQRVGDPNATDPRPKRVTRW